MLIWPYGDSPVSRDLFRAMLSDKVHKSFNIVWIGCEISWGSLTMFVYHDMHVSQTNNSTGVVRVNAQSELII